MKRIVSGIMLTLFLIGTLSLVINIQPVKAGTKTWTVDDDGPADFHRIQDAINTATSGDTINVSNGIYYEHLTVDKPLKIVGENKFNTIIDGSGTRAVIGIYVHDVAISGFTVRNGGQFTYYYFDSSCIYIETHGRCSIQGNMLLNSRYGIGAFYSSNNTIIGNTISNCTESGISLDAASNNVISGNAISDTETGMHLYRSHNNTIVNNVILNNTLGSPNWGGGIYLDRSTNNTISYNKITNTTEVGVWHQYSYYNTIVGNVISQNTEIEMIHSSGIYLGDYSYGNIVLDNVISKSLVGIYGSQLAYNNIIIGNTITNLTRYMCGINIWGPGNRIIGNIITNMGYVGIQLNSISSDGLYGVPNACANNIVRGNAIYNSTFGINLILAASSNTIDGNNVSNNGLGILISDHSDGNTITKNVVSNNYYGILLFLSDNTKVCHNNFIDNTEQVLLSGPFNTAWDDGYPSGGNHWSNYGGVDVDGDGIGDTPYFIDADNQDNYPFIEPLSLRPKLPIASFTCSPSKPRTGETITFDASASNPDEGGIAIYIWNFDDTTTAITTKPTINHIYSMQGTYNITLTVINDNGLRNSTSCLVDVITPDVAVISITRFSDHCYMGHAVKVNVTVKNEGHQNETFSVMLYYNITSGGIIGTQIVNNLTPDEYKTLTFIFDTTDLAPCSSYTITAVASTVPYETDVKDNILEDGKIKIRLFGDTNGDGYVGISDIVSCAEHFGESSDRPRWNLDCDMNLDNYIGIDDIVLIASNFGKTYP